MANRLSTQRRAQIVSCLVEGNSIRSTSRMTGAAKGTVLKLLADLGDVCARYQDSVLRYLPCKRIECDEIWSFCGMKEARVPEELRAKAWLGDVYTWTALCADTKLVPSWLVGRRDAHYAAKFIEDLASRLRHRIQLTTDGHRPYLEAVEGAFGADVDYAMLIKLYGSDPESARRYSPPKVTGTDRQVISGRPSSDHISTSYVERQNLTMRMSMRRFTRLTNAFSKKIENHHYAVSLHFMNYNFARIHSSLRVTPAMETGISDHVWSIEEIVGLLENEERSN